jgi:hypothetical protein
MLSLSKHGCRGGITRLRLVIPGGWLQSQTKAQPLMRGCVFYFLPFSHKQAWLKVRK